MTATETARINDRTADGEITVHGYRIGLPGHLSARMRATLSAGGYELREVSLIRRVLRPRDRVLELGTGSGVTSLAIAGIVGTANLRGYDGNPAVVDWARDNGRRNGVELDVRHGVVVPVRTSPAVEFLVTDDFWASSVADRPKADREAGVLVSAPTVAFDEVAAEFGPNVLVTDIEGAEVELFTTSELPGIRKIVCEFHYAIRGERDTDEAIAALYRLGFRMHAGFSANQVCFFRRPA